MYQKKKLNLSILIPICLLAIISIITIYSAQAFIPKTNGNLALKQSIWYLVGSILVVILVKLKNELNGKSVAQECANWIKSKAKFKSNIDGQAIQKFMTIENKQDTYMKKTIPLSELEINITGIIREINCNSSVKRRLLDLGLIPNTEITPIFSSLAGDPIAYEVRNIIIAIRKHDADKILVVHQ